MSSGLGEIVLYSRLQNQALAAIRAHCNGMQMSAMALRQKGPILGQDVR
jgi:hypothetical protein